MVDLNHVASRLDQHVPAVVEAPKQAAVAAVLTPQLDVLFIRRAEHPQDPWSGHMAFPGGRKDPGDGSLLDTALRETREELAVDLSGACLLGRLDDLATHRTGLMVRPFVFVVDTPPLIQGNHEVAETLWAPIAPLMQGERDAEYPYEHEGRSMRFPAYDVDGRIVWGLTYRMLRSLFGLL